MRNFAALFEWSSRSITEKYKVFPKKTKQYLLNGGSCMIDKICLSTLKL